jgi:hypothetical protein
MTSLFDLTANTPGLPCRTTNPALFHSDNPRERRQAASKCQGCPLLLDCRTYAFETRQEWGVWGGLDFTAVETYCGTDRGYLIHRRNGEIPCGPCLEVHAEVVDGRRRAQLAKEHAKGGTSRGYEIHHRLGERACDPCREAQARKSREHRARSRRGRVQLAALPVTDEARDVLPGPQAAVQPLALAG